MQLIALKLSVRASVSAAMSSGSRQRFKDGQTFWRTRTVTDKLLRAADQLGSPSQLSAGRMSDYTPLEVSMSELLVKRRVLPGSHASQSRWSLATELDDVLDERAHQRPVVDLGVGVQWTRKLFFQTGRRILLAAEEPEVVIRE